MVPIFDLSQCNLYLNVYNCTTMWQFVLHPHGLKGVHVCNRTGFLISSRFLLIQVAPKISH